MRRWLPNRALIVVTDGGYAALDLLNWCARQARPITVITRLRLDAALYEPATRAPTGAERSAAAQG